MFRRKRKSDITTVYRLEDSRGCGVYTKNYNIKDPKTGKIIRWSDGFPHSGSIYDIVPGIKMFNTSKKHPLPQNDFGKDARELAEKLKIQKSKCIFGFPTKTSFKKWFNPTQRKILENNGIKLSVIRIPKDRVISTKNQCVFDKTSILKKRVLKPRKKSNGK